MGRAVHRTCHYTTRPTSAWAIFMSKEALLVPTYYLSVPDKLMVIDSIAAQVYFLELRTCMENVLQGTVVLEC